MTPPELHVDAFRTWVATRLGIDVQRPSLLAEVLARRCRATRTEPADYLARGAVLDIEELARELTVGETYFFRGAEQLEALVRDVLPACLRESRRPVRILSAGCSTGEEPFSIAIAIREAGVDPASLQIRGVDVNPRALQHARGGRYSTWSLRETPASVAKTWFRRSGGDHVLAGEIVRSVTFEERNLATDDRELWAPDSYDVVFCRNVLIYFTRDQTRALLARMVRALRRTGVLFLGHADGLSGTLSGTIEQLQLHRSRGAFYYRHAERATAKMEVRAERRATAEIAMAREQAPPPPPPADVGTNPALELLQAERFAEALAALDRADLGGVADAELVRATLYLHLNRLDETEQLCASLIAGAPAAAASLHHLAARCREARGDLIGAVTHDRLAVTRDPEFGIARLHLGLIARKVGDRVTARAELSEAIRALGAETAIRLLLFGGGFGRSALITVCERELDRL